MPASTGSQFKSFRCGVLSAKMEETEGVEEVEVAEAA
jgi:hypothetical protein